MSDVILPLFFTLLGLFAVTGVLALLVFGGALALPRGGGDALIKLLGIELLLVIAALVGVTLTLRSADRFVADLPEDARGETLAETKAIIEERFAPPPPPVPEEELPPPPPPSDAERAGMTMRRLVELRVDLARYGTPSINFLHPDAAEAKALAAARLLSLLEVAGLEGVEAPSEEELEALEAWVEEQEDERAADAALEAGEQGEGQNDEQAGARADTRRGQGAEGEELEDPAARLAELGVNPEEVRERARSALGRFQAAEGFAPGQAQGYLGPGTWPVLERAVLDRLRRAVGEAAEGVEPLLLPDEDEAGAEG